VISLEDGKHTLIVEATDDDGTVYRRTVTFRFGDKPEWIDFGRIPIFAFLGILSLLSAALVFGGAQMLSNLMMRKGKGGRQL